MRHSSLAHIEEVHKYSLMFWYFVHEDILFSLHAQLINYVHHQPQNIITSVYYVCSLLVFHLRNKNVNVIFVDGFSQESKTPSQK